MAACFLSTYLLIIYVFISISIYIYLSIYLSIYLNLSIIAHKSGLLRQWEVDELAKPELVKTFRSIHTGPISLLKVSFFFSQKNSKVMQCVPLLRILLGAGVYIMAAQKIISYLTFFFQFSLFFFAIFFLISIFSGFFWRS